MTRSDLALAALASAAVPGMRPVSVRGVRPSRDHPAPRHQVAFVEDSTGRRWVVRAPLDPAAGAELERNDALVRLLGRHLPFTVPVPAGYASLGADGRAAVYPYVPGVALRLRELPGGSGLASAVGRAVAAVHNIPRQLFEEGGVPVFDAAGYRARRLAELDRAAETGRVPQGLLARWEQALEAAPLWQFATVPTHGSLDGSSFLVAFTDDDAATGRVVALTGWERAQVADPADDLAALVEQASPAAFGAVLDSYALARSQRPDPHLAIRARLAAEMQPLAGLARAAASDDTEQLRRLGEQLRRLDRLVSGEDRLVPRTVQVAAEPADRGPGKRPEPEPETPHHSAPSPARGAVPDEATQAVPTRQPTGAAPRHPQEAPEDDGGGEQAPGEGAVPSDDTVEIPVMRPDGPGGARVSPTPEPRSQDPDPPAPEEPRSDLR